MNSGRIMGSDCIVMRSTKHPKEAFRLVQWFLSDKCQNMKARSKLVVPVLKRAMNSKDFLMGPPAHMNIIPKMALTATQFPLYLGYNDVIARVSDDVVKMLSGRKSVTDTLNIATTEANRILSRYK